MTASDATATIKKGNSEPSFDKTAQRILNLFFVLNSSPEPLTTEQIVLDSDLGYGSGNIDSDKRKFRRDRDKLLERGILIKEVRPAGAQETEESSWTIDREHTFAAGGLITADDADILLNAIDQTLAAGSSTFATPLADIRSKIAYLTGRTTADEATISRSPPSMRYGAPLPSDARCDFYIRTDAVSKKSVPSASTACSSARAWRTSAASTMPPTTSGHSAATVSFTLGVLRRPTPSLWTSTSTTTCSLNSILPTDRPLQLRSHSPLRRRSI